MFLEDLSGRFLVLLRNANKPQGNTWGIPSGKVEDNEKLEDCILRELSEETGNNFNIKDLGYFKKFYVRYPDYDFIYHIFYLKLNEDIDIVLEKDGHKDYRWVTPEESLELNYIQDLDECVKEYYKILR